MIPPKIWQKSWIRSLAATFCFLLVLFYLLFSLIDVAVNSKRLLSYMGFSFWQLTVYYFYQFLRYLDVFLPLSFLLSCIYVLTEKKKRFEICALQMAGISSFQLFYPIFLLGVGLMSITYLNYEWGVPASLPYTKPHWNQKQISYKKSLYTHIFPDGSKLIFSHYDPSKQLLSPAFWILTPEAFWYIKGIDLSKNQGKYADYFEKQLSFFQKTKSQKQIDLPKISLSISTFLPIEFQPFSELYQQNLNPLPPEKKAILATYWHLRCASPFLFLLIALACFPFCIRFQRNPSSLLIYAISLFSFIGFKALLGALVILSENEILSPFWGIWSPFFLCFLALFFPLLYDFFLKKKFVFFQKDSFKE